MAMRSTIDNAPLTESIESVRGVSRRKSSRASGGLALAVGALLHPGAQCPGSGAGDA